MASHQFLARHGLAGPAELGIGDQTGGLETVASSEGYVGTAQQQRNLNHNHGGPAGRRSDDPMFPRVPLPHAASQRVYPDPVHDEMINLRGLQIAPGPHPQMKPGPHVQVMADADQMRPGPHVQMGAPGTLVDRVLDITAIQQQPKLL